jgi:hypothetical protein
VEECGRRCLLLQGDIRDKEVCRQVGSIEAELFSLYTALLTRRCLALNLADSSSCLLARVAPPECV